MIIIMILIDGFFDNFFIKSRGGAVRPITVSAGDGAENLHIFFGDDIERLRE